MSVANLIDMLDNFGDHLPVVIETESPTGEIYEYHYVNVGTAVLSGETCVILTLGTRRKT